ncbi:MAG TPA: hypothetical protein VGM94_12815 [Galbitalea sp.]|jgi:hypothetical protein
MALRDLDQEMQDFEGERQRRIQELGEPKAAAEKQFRLDLDELRSALVASGRAPVAGLINETRVDCWLLDYGLVFYDGDLYTSDGPSTARSFPWGLRRSMGFAKEDEYYRIGNLISPSVAYSDNVDTRPHQQPFHSWSAGNATLSFPVSWGNYETVNARWFLASLVKDIR